METSSFIPQVKISITFSISMVVCITFRFLLVCLNGFFFQNSYYETMLLRYTKPYDMFLTRVKKRLALRLI